MRKLAREEEIETKARRKELRKRNALLNGDEAPEDDEAADSNDDSASEPEADDAGPLPQHESLNTSKSEDEVERASRTVFLGNVSTTVLTSKSAKKELLTHLKLSTSSSPLQIESIRFRSTPYADLKLPKKAAYVTGDIHDATAKSTNAYAVYKSTAMARTAVSKLNGTIVLDRHLRADSVAHPAKTDHRRCVFVGNLGFVDDESAIVSAENEDRLERTEGAKKRKAKPPGDVEEGLWRQFGKAGTVESVRVVRDAKTRVGKGFAYVQFQNGDVVDLALLYDGKKYPPMLPRKLRVTRAKNPNKMQKTGRERGVVERRSQRVRDGNDDGDERGKSMQGRAGKLFGKAGAAGLGRPQFREGDRAQPFPRGKLEGIVFEGTRATKQGGTQSKLASGKGQSKRSKGKPTTRSSRRGSAWKTSGGKK